MLRLRLGFLVVMVAAIALVGVGCGGDDDAGTTGGSTTPATTAPAPSTDTTPAGGSGGDVAAGKTFFEGTCQGCHLNGGTQAGAGPVLAGRGLAEQRIRDQVTNGGGGMPPGLAEGADLDNVAAFVLSIQ